jgi:hypothetical protein
VLVTGNSRHRNRHDSAGARNGQVQDRAFAAVFGSLATRNFAPETARFHRPVEGESMAIDGSTASRGQSPGRARASGTRATRKISVCKELAMVGVSARCYAIPAALRAGRCPTRFPLRPSLNSRPHAARGPRCRPTGQNRASWRPNAAA